MCLLSGLLGFSPQDYAVNNLLYQRGIYPPDEFERVQQYGVPVLISKEKRVKQFINNALNQSSGML